MRLSLADRDDLGGEFFRWEMATAVAAIVLGVNPFDEPNVAQAKDATNGSTAQADLYARSEAAFETLVKNYNGVLYQDGDLGQWGRLKLIEVRTLSVGRLAREIDGMASGEGKETPMVIVGKRKNRSAAIANIPLFPLFPFVMKNGYCIFQYTEEALLPWLAPQY